MMKMASVAESGSTASPKSESPCKSEKARPVDRKIYWRCFHCGDAFTRAHERWARQHFGADQDALPVCQMRLPGEHHLLTILRKQEDELNAYRSEDTDLWRSLYAMSADHAAALRREEEQGYEKGLADGRAYPTSADHQSGEAVPALSATDGPPSTPSAEGGVL